MCVLLENKSLSKCSFSNQSQTRAGLCLITFSSVFGILHLIDILETNILSFPILNIVTVFLCIKSSLKNQWYLVVTVLCQGLPFAAIPLTSVTGNMTAALQAALKNPPINTKSQAVKVSHRHTVISAGILAFLPKPSEVSWNQQIF